MRRAVKSPSRPWLRLACVLFGLLLLGVSVSRSTYYFCAALQQTHASPCCKGAAKSAPGAPAVAPVCCEERDGGGLAERGTAPSTAPTVSVLAATVTELLPSDWQLPTRGVVQAARWPIRAGPSHASDVVIELRVLLS